MTSQSPDCEGEESEAYTQAWSSLTDMIRNRGISWSGREANHVFLNGGQGQFCDLSGISAADFLDDGRTVVPIDWDGDGRQDLLLRSRTAPRVRLIRNAFPAAGNSMTIALQGVECNRDAIGAQVVVTAGSRTLRQTLHAGDGYLSQGSKRLFFGLGNAESVERVEVIWPDGSREQWNDLLAGHDHTLVQGQTSIDSMLRGSNLKATRVAMKPLQTTNGSVVRIPLIEKIPLPYLSIPSLADANRTVSDFAGGPMLVNLWSVECLNCLAEMKEFKDYQQHLDKARLRVVTLNTDPASKRARVHQIAEQMGVTEHAGIADDAFLAALEIVLFEVTASTPGSPLPTSLLFDGRGRLCVVYQGRVKASTLLTDLALLRTIPSNQNSSHQLLRGKRLTKRGRNWKFLANNFETIGFSEQAKLFRELAATAAGQ